MLTGKFKRKENWMKYTKKNNKNKKSIFYLWKSLEQFSLIITIENENQYKNKLTFNFDLKPIV